MVLMMESQCEYFMYFPAVPITDLSDPSKYRTLPRRSHLYLGETVQFLLVLRSRDERSGSGETKGSGDSDSGTRAWKELVGSLSAVASVCPGESRHRSQLHPHEFQRSYSDDGADEDPDEVDFAVGTSHIGRRESRNRGFRECKPLLIHNNTGIDGRQYRRAPVQIVVTVWKQEKENVEIREHGYLTILQLRSPRHTFRQDLNTFKAQVSTTLSVLPPPTVKCQQITVSGKHLTVLKVLNSSSQDEVCVSNVRVVPNFNASYLPMMPDGSVLLVDNVCHQSAEVAMGSFHRMNSSSSHLPSMLSALEEQNFLYISTHYQLPSVRLDRPRLVMTASCPSAVRPQEHFRVKYTLLNNLQDFLAVRLVWTPEGRGRQDPSVSSVVCHSPLNNLGQCRKGSTLSFTVAFQILKAGLFELSQHMKLKLQFTASCSNPSAEARPMSLSLSRNNSAVRDVLDRQSLGRTGSVMERRAITPPVGSPVGRPLYLPPERPVLSLDKIAKRECKVLVLDLGRDWESEGGRVGGT
ncbi:unnamed protein product, partial [Coregonus sp. 'balchen']